MVTMYGIANCDTIKKARRWLDEHQVQYQFHDYRKQGIDSATLRQWCRELGHEQLINRRGTTWRKLDDVHKQDLDTDKAVAIMRNNPSIIKRPLLDTGSEKILGFDQSRYQSLL